MSVKKSFYLQSELSLHCVHIEEKSYVYDICQKSFSTRDNSITHTTCHHLKRSEVQEKDMKLISHLSLTQTCKTELIFEKKIISLSCVSKIISSPEWTESASS